VYWSEASLGHRVQMGRKGAGLMSHERLMAARRALEGPVGKRVQIEATSPYSRIADRFLCDTHDADLWKRLREVDHALRAAGGGVGRLEPKNADTEISAGSADAHRATVAGMLSCIDAVLDGRASSAFALGLPGHHATRSQAMGFCFVNTVAVGAQYAIRRKGLARVLVIDIDVHHGNGTQDIFYDRADVLFVSLHRYPSVRFYPLSGWSSEEGEGRGRGYNINVPLKPPAGDAEYLAALDGIHSRLVAFRPELVLVSAGFDAHVCWPCRMNLRADELGGPEGLTRVAMPRGLGRRDGAGIYGG
jgi:acetoin utilization deacetylase AcuC-like enzyme